MGKPTQTVLPHRSLIGLAWTTTLCVSMFLYPLLHGPAGSAPAWLK